MLFRCRRFCRKFSATCALVTLCLTLPPAGGGIPFKPPPLAITLHVAEGLPSVSVAVAPTINNVRQPSSRRWLQLRHS